MANDILRRPSREVAKRRDGLSIRYVRIHTVISVLCYTSCCSAEHGFGFMHVVVGRKNIIRSLVFRLNFNVVL